ncbi:Peptidase M50 [Nitrospira lenta]|uniref:Peptidase M50 n=2 Tax=Nitrospira lenta TaxID=1436998 RepID=A0A330L266_9BACT|nr:site-2 protease family protein [Nitrospira lenta]SPP63845.1 Peptidase M50 [Nitrospira lenta]
MKTLIALLSGVKFGKVLLTSGTMVLSVVTYSFVYGWPYAVGLVGLIFCHEMGHFAAAKQRGLEVGAPTFIPFVGAWIQLKAQPMDVETEAYVAMAGPVVGTVAAMGCYYAANSTHSPLLRALAYAGFMINLFNLIPLSPLDGGRITSIISPKTWWVGAPLIVALFAWSHSPMLLLIAVMAVPHLLSTMRKGESFSGSYYDVSPATRWSYAAYYLLLVGFLGVMTFESYRTTAL